MNRTTFCVVRMANSMLGVAFDPTGLSAAQLHLLQLTRDAV